MSYYIISASIIVLRSDAEEEPSKFFDEVYEVKTSSSILHGETDEDVSALYDSDYLNDILPQKPGLYIIHTIFSVHCNRTHEGEYDCDYDVQHEVISRFSDKDQQEYLEQYFENKNNGDLE